MRKALILIGVTIAISGCAGQKVAPPAAGSPTVGAAAAAQPAPKQRSVDDIVLDAKRQGFTVTNQDGEELLCRSQLRSGSHIVKDTVCMTPADYDELRRRTQQSMANTLSNTSPKQFK